MSLILHTISYNPRCHESYYLIFIPVSKLLGPRELRCFEDQWFEAKVLSKYTEADHFSQCRSCLTCFTLHTVVICALHTGLVPCTAALKQMSHPLPHCRGLETGARRDHEAVMEDLKKKVRSQQDHQESRHVRRLHWRIRRTCFVGWAFLCRWNRNRWQSALSTQRPARLSPQDKRVTTILERLGHRIKACIHWLRKFVAPAGDATVRQEHQVWRILTMFDVQLGVAMLHFVARPIAARHNAASVLREDALLKQKQAKEIRNTSTVQYVNLIGYVLAIACYSYINLYYYLNCCHS